MLKPIKGHPGRFLEVSSGKIISISEYREDDKYDTVMVWDNDGTQPLPPGRQFVFFRDVTKKKPVDTNFTQPSKLSPGESMVIDRVGLYVRVIVGNQTMEGVTPPLGSIFVGENAHLRVEVNQKLLTEGPAIKYPSGYGYNNDILTFNFGEASTRNTSKMVKTQFINYRYDLVGYLTFYDRDVWVKQFFPDGVGMPTFAEPVFVVCFLHGLVKDAINK